MKPEGLLRKLTALIVRACDPQQVILFGSYAKGQQQHDSDLDILVVGDFGGSPFLRDLELRQLLLSCPVRIDLHVTTEQEVAAAASQPRGFLQSVLDSGVVLYARQRTHDLTGRLTPGCLAGTNEPFGET